MEVYKVIVYEPDGVFEGLEGDQNLGFNIHARHVVVLVPDWLILIELVDLLVEVGARKGLAVCLIVGGLQVGGTKFEVVGVLFFENPELGGRCQGSNVCSHDCSREFHSFCYNFQFSGSEVILNKIPVN